MCFYVVNKILKGYFKGRFEFFRMILQLCKMMLYFFSIIKSQNKLLTAPQNRGKYLVSAKNYMDVLVIYDIAFFYFTIVALILFNAVIRCRRFHTVRERMIGSIERFKHLRGDSLYIAREDIFWFSVTITRILLFIMIDCNRYKTFTDSRPVRFCIIGMNIVNLYVVYQVFFAHTKNNFLMDSGYRKCKVPILFIIYGILFGLEIAVLSQM